MLIFFYDHDRQCHYSKFPDCIIMARLNFSSVESLVLSKTSPLIFNCQYTISVMMLKYRQ